MTTPILHLTDRATERALSALERGDAGDALEQLTRAIALNPRNAYAYATRGYLYLDMGDRDRAVADLTSAIEAAPEEAHWREFRANLYQHIGDLPHAIADLDMILEVDPGDADIIIERGTFWFRLGKLDAAIADFSKALSLDPRSDQAHYMRGRAWLEKARYANAVVDLTECLRLAPTRVDAYAARGETFARRATRPNTRSAKALLYSNRAVVDLDRAIALDPQDSTVYWWRGRANRSAGRYDASIVDLTKALGLCSDPGSMWASVLYSDRAQTFHAKGKQSRNEQDFDLAISDLNDAIARDPQTTYRFDLLVSCHIDRGYLRLRTKQFDAAIADFSKVIGTDRGAEPCLVSRSFVRRGRAYFVAGLYDLAIVDFTEALSLHPGNADACCGRGKAWSAKGEHVHAIADFTTVIQNRPLDIDAYRFRALAWQAIDDRDAAARDLTTALSVASEAWTDTESTTIDLACAHVLMCAGRTDEARSLYLKCRGELDCGKFESAFVLPPTWEQKILADFAELDKVGLHHSLMDEIAATFLRSARAGFDQYGSYHRPAK